MSDDPRTRFSNRVGDYVSHRPGYPVPLLDAVIELLADPGNGKIADIGSGTGIFTRELLARGLEVCALEPNAEMRAAAEREFAAEPGFSSSDGSAEATGLDAASVDLITAAQAFHWFNNERSRAEWQRILKPGGRVALIWNRRRLANPFQQAYDALLRRHAPEYGKVNHMDLGADAIAAFLAPGKLEVQRFDNSQRLGFEHLLGRLRSSSYCPPENSDNYAELVAELKRLFDQHAGDGIVDFEYDCELYCGGFD